MAAAGGKPFQRTFGRTAQTKALDHVWAHRDEGVNIRRLADRIRHSYVYTVNVVAGLEEQGLVIKEVAGREVLVRPNLGHPAIAAITNSA